MAGTGGGKGGGNQTPLINPWVAARYGPLNLPQIFHDLSENYLKLISKYDGEKIISVEEHMLSFQYLTDNMFIENDDVFMRFFVQNLEGDVREWFKGLPPASINSWTILETTFMRQWGEKNDHLYYLTEFGSLNKKVGESVVEFNKRFNKLYNKIPHDIKPSQVEAKVTYVGAFEVDFSMMLREIRYETLIIMQYDSIYIEGNMIVSGNLKPRTDHNR
jgi:hypothetical protein